MIGKALTNLKLPSHYQLYILKIERKSTDGINILPMRYQEMAGPTSIVQEHDILSIKGPKEKAEELKDDYVLTLEAEEHEAEDLVSKQLGMAEVLLTDRKSVV